MTPFAYLSTGPLFTALRVSLHGYKAILAGAAKHNDN